MLVNESYPQPGPRTIDWCFDDSEGKQLPSGFFIYRVTIDGDGESRVIRRSEDDSAEVAIDIRGRSVPAKQFLIGDEENPTITVREGDRITLTFSSDGGSHDWVWGDDRDPVVQYAATEIVGGGSSAPAIEFTADRVGDFPYYCSVGSHRAQGMEGRFVVEAAS